MLPLLFVQATVTQITLGCALCSGREHLSVQIADLRVQSLYTVPSDASRGELSNAPFGLEIGPPQRRGLEKQCLPSAALEVHDVWPSVGVRGPS